MGGDLTAKTGRAWAMSGERAWQEYTGAAQNDTPGDKQIWRAMNRKRG